MSSSVVYPAENRHKKRPICRVEQISLVISCKTRGASSPVCWLCRAAERSAPTTPLLRFILAYAQPKVNMRAKLLPYANRKADTETAAQAVRCARTAQAVRPVRAGSFAVNHSGELPLRAAGAQEGRQPAVFHPLVNLPFSLLPWVQMVDCVSRKRTRQSGYLSVSFSAFSQFTDRLLLHISATFRRRGITVPRKFFTRAEYSHPAVVADWHRKTCCATRVCRACVELILCVAVRSPTLRIGCERCGRKNPLPFPFFRSGHMSAICARPSKGKG